MRQAACALPVFELGRAGPLPSPPLTCRVTGEPSSAEAGVAATGGLDDGERAPPGGSAEARAAATGGSVASNLLSTFVGIKLWTERKECGTASTPATARQCSLMFASCARWRRRRIAARFAIGATAPIFGVLGGAQPRTSDSTPRAPLPCAASGRCSGFFLTPSLSKRTPVEADEPAAPNPSFGLRRRFKDQRRPNRLRCPPLSLSVCGLGSNLKYRSCSLEELFLSPGDSLATGSDGCFLTC